MSETPRTDAALKSFYTPPYNFRFCDLTDFTAKLERELAQAIKARDENKAGWDSCSLTALRLEQERNRAVRCLQAIQEYLAAAHEDGDTLAGIEALIHEWKVSTK